MKRRARPKRRKWWLRATFALVFALAVGALGWFYWVYSQIERYAGQDQVFQFEQASKPDAIGVFGAAHALTTRSLSTAAASHH